MLKTVPQVADEIRSLTTIAVQLATRYECDYYIYLFPTGNYALRDEKPVGVALDYIRVQANTRTVIYHTLITDTHDSRPFADFEPDVQPFIIDLTGQ